MWGSLFSLQRGKENGYTCTSKKEHSKLKDFVSVSKGDYASRKELSWYIPFSKGGYSKWKKICSSFFLE